MPDPDRLARPHKLSRSRLRGNARAGSDSGTGAHSSRVPSNQPSGGAADRQSRGARAVDGRCGPRPVSRRIHTRHRKQTRAMPSFARTRRCLPGPPAMRQAARSTKAIPVRNSPRLTQWCSGVPSSRSCHPSSRPRKVVGSSGRPQRLHTHPCRAMNIAYSNRMRIHGGRDGVTARAFCTCSCHGADTDWAPRA